MYCSCILFVFESQLDDLLFIGSDILIPALIRDDSKIQRVQGSATKPIIYMFTAAGREMAAIRVRTYVSRSLFGRVCWRGVIFKKLGIGSLILASKPVTGFKNSIQARPRFILVRH